MSMDRYQTHVSQAAAPAACALDATGVKLRIPVTDILDVTEFGCAVVGATAPGTGLVLKLQYEPVGGGAAVDLATATSTTAVTQGTRLVRRVDVHVEKGSLFVNGVPQTGTPAFLVVSVSSAGATGSTGVVYCKLMHGGTPAAAPNDVVVSS
jgi:hypothetical protein